MIVQEKDKRGTCAKESGRIITILNKARLIFSF
jgi:hypothetical protein